MFFFFALGSNEPASEFSLLLLLIRLCKATHSRKRSAALLFQRGTAKIRAVLLAHDSHWFPPLLEICKVLILKYRMYSPCLGLDVMYAYSYITMYKHDSSPDSSQFDEHKTSTDRENILLLRDILVTYSQENLTQD